MDGHIRAAAFVPAMVLMACAVAAQPALERVVGVDGLGNPVLVETIDASLAGKMSSATGFRFGFEILPRDAAEKSPRRKGVQLTGRTLLEALQAITSLDPRYDWRIVDDTVVVRPSTAWGDEAHPLHQRIAPIRLERTRLHLMVELLRCLLGKCMDRPHFTTSDTEDITLDLPSGTLLNFLNGMARAHGRMTWTFGCLPGASEKPDKCRPSVTVWELQGSGESLLVEGPAPSRPIDLSKFEHKRTAVTSGELGAHQPILSRIVQRPTASHWERFHGISSDIVQRLSSVTGVPMGIEMVMPAVHYPAGLDLTGRTLQDALNALIAIDPRYEWRELNGVVVFRSVEAWTRNTGPLAMPTPAIRFEGRVGMAAAILQAMAGIPPLTDATSDTRTFKIDLAPATVLDFLNTTILAHGEMNWAVEPIPEDDYRRVMFRHDITFISFNGRRSTIHVPW